LQRAKSDQRTHAIILLSWGDVGLAVDGIALAFLCFNEARLI